MRCLLCLTLSLTWHPHGNGASRPQSETSEAVNQDKPFLFQVDFSWIPGTMRSQTTHNSRAIKSHFQRVKKRSLYSTAFPQEPASIPHTLGFYIQTLPSSLWTSPAHLGQANSLVKRQNLFPHTLSKALSVVLSVVLLPQQKKVMNPVWSHLQPQHSRYRTRKIRCLMSSSATWWVQDPPGLHEIWSQNTF